MRKILPSFLALIALLHSSHAWAAKDGTASPDAPASGHLIFEAKVADLVLPSNSLAAGMKPDDSVPVTLPGELFNPAIEIQTVLKTAVRRNTPEAASASDYSAF